MDNQQYSSVSDQAVLLQVDGVGRSERADSAPVIGVGWNKADSAPVISQSFVVRIKDVPQILGEENSMLKNISEVSGASLSISVDMRNIMNRTVQINAWGREEDVDEAETMILNVITEGYKDPLAFLPLIHGYVHQLVKRLFTAGVNKSPGAAYGYTGAKFRSHLVDYIKKYYKESARGHISKGVVGQGGTASTSRKRKMEAKEIDHTKSDLIFLNPKTKNTYKVVEILGNLDSIERDDGIFSSLDQDKLIKDQVKKHVSERNEPAPELTCLINIFMSQIWRKSRFTSLMTQ